MRATMTMFCVVVLAAGLFLGGCADEPDPSPTGSPPARAVAGPFTRSEFIGYEMVTMAADSYRLPYANDIVFRQVRALYGNAFLHIPRAVGWRMSPLTVTVDETILPAFLLSGTAVRVVVPERCMEEEGDCWELADAEVIFRDAAGVEAFDAALRAVRMPE